MGMIPGMGGLMKMMGDVDHEGDMKRLRRASSTR